jgi:hypothetical protein
MPHVSAILSPVEEIIRSTVMESTRETRTLLIKASPRAKWGLIMKRVAIAFSLLLLVLAGYLTLKKHFAEQGADPASRSPMATAGR